MLPIIKPSLKIGQRVRYTEDGILSMIYGHIAGWHFNEANDRIEYAIKWDGEHKIDNRLYPKNSLHPV